MLKGLANAQKTSKTPRDASDTCHGPRGNPVPEGKIDDCRSGPSVIELRLEPAREVLGYEFWDNEPETWRKSNQRASI